jgi:hypothetical protein
MYDFIIIICNLYILPETIDHPIANLQSVTPRPDYQNPALSYATLRGIALLLGTQDLRNVKP